MEVQSLQDQVARLERSNRDTLSLLDARNSAHDRLAEDLASQHQKSVALRRELATLEERYQSSENAASTAKFRESNLQQEVDLLKRNNDWFESELKTKAAEHAKFRKERSGRIAELTRLNEEVSSNLETSQRVEKTLRSRLGEVEQKAENALIKIQAMQEEASRVEESFKVELESARRLAGLYEQSVDTARRRVQELEDNLEQTKIDAANEISQVQAELETERQDREATEQKIATLETQLETMQTQQLPQRTGSPSPGTPRRPAGDARTMTTPLRAGSPAATTPASSRARGGLSMTQMYSQYTAMQNELDIERRRNEKLSSTMDEMIQDLERREPEMQELQLEHERLQAEIGHLSTALARAGSEKESLYKESRKWQSQAEGLAREGDLLRQQLRDLSAQIKVLLVEVQMRSEGIEFGAAERMQLQRAARNDIELDALEGMSDTGRFISQRLTTFKNLFELQDTNAKLLHLTRQLGERMEGEEAQAERNEREQQRQELESLQGRIEQYKDEMKSLITQSQSYIRERDMFRRMLSHRGQIPQDVDTTAVFGSSVNVPGTPRTPHIGRQSVAEDSQLSIQLAENAKVIKELQSHFDAYRQEAATDHATLREQAERLAKEKSDLQQTIARTSSQLSLSQERYDMLQANYQMLKTEIAEIQKRSNSLNEIAAKQDLRTQQVAEELVEARGLADSLRNENANLRAEKDLWKKIEQRLSEDNHNLTGERSRLNKLVADTQTLANERELTEAEARRKLQSQIEILESELRSVRQKLEDEVEESKKIASRREYEQEQTRSRHDDLLKGLSNAKEQLAAANGMRDQLQARVDELKIELRAAEERAHALQAPALVPVHTTISQADASSEQDDIERNLKMELAETKRELGLAFNQLENAKTQVEQYKAISQSSEEELQSLNDSTDQFREDTDRQIAEKDAEIHELKQRVEDILSELATTNSQLGEVRQSAQDNVIRLEQQKSSFESDLAQVKEERERFEEMAKFHQEDLKVQAEIAQQAQQSYEQELVKHAEAAKALQNVRQECNQVRLELSEAKADAEAAKSTLAQNEESWQSSSESYERELFEIKVRRNEVDAQNKVLHQQLENVSRQITALQQTRNTTSEVSENQPTLDSGLSNLQEVIRFLRREKEIVDVQYELSVQEARRLKQQLDYAQSQLDEVRSKLDQERQRQNDGERNMNSHAKLMDTINELNVFRESSVTLRAEARQAQSQLVETSARVEELQAQIEPLQASVREIENERDTILGEMKLLREDRERWQHRAQNILQKYDRIDPAELENLKEQLSQLKSEQEQWSSEKQTMQERIDKIPEELEVAKEEATAPLRAGREKLIEQFKSRSKDLSAKIRGIEAENKSLIAQLESTKAELDAAIKSQNEAAANTVTAQSNSASQPQMDANTEIDDGAKGSEAEDGEVANVDDGAIDAAQQLEAITTKLDERNSKNKQLEEEIKTLNNRVLELEDQVRESQTKLENSERELQALQSRTAHSSNVDTEQLDKLKADLAAAKGEVEALHAKSSAPDETSTAAVDTVMTNDIPAPAGNDASLVETQINARRVELEKEYEEKEKALEEKYNTRTTNMRTTLNNKLKEAREKFGLERDEAVQKLREESNIQLTQAASDHAAQLSKLETEHGANISRLNEAHAKEVATLKSSPPSSTPTNGSVAAVEASGAPATTNNTNDGDVSTLSPAQVTSLLRDNPTVKSILAKNVKNKLEQEIVRVKAEHEKATLEKVDEEVSKVRADQEKVIAEKLEEVKNKFEAIREQAVIVEGKKWTAKFSMAEGRARTALAKIEIFRKAADETPQKPVAEVWAIAKDFKPPPPQATAAGPAASAPAPASTAPATTPGPAAALAGKAAPTSATPDVQKMNNVTATSTASDTPSVPPAAKGMDAVQNASPSNGGRPSTSAAPTDQTKQVPQEAPGDTKAAPAVGTGPGALRSIAAQGSGIPRGGGTSRIASLGGRGGGRGGNAASAQGGTPQASSLPAPPSNLPTLNQMGASIRGAAGGNRGGRGRGQNHGGSPGRGNMNPSARQFVPNKRPREGSSDAGDGGNGGKRARGGGEGQS